MSRGLKALELVRIPLSTDIKFLPLSTHYQMDPLGFVPLSARGVISVGKSSQLKLKRNWRESSRSGSYDGPVWTGEMVPRLARL